MVRESHRGKRDLRTSKSIWGQIVLLEDMWLIGVYVAGHLGDLVRLGATDKCPSQQWGRWKAVKRPFHEDCQIQP